MTVVMNCFHCGCIPLHSHRAFCVISDDTSYPHYNPNGSIYYIHIFEPVLLELYGCNFWNSTRHFLLLHLSKYTHNISYMIHIEMPHIFNTQHMK